MNTPTVHAVIVLIVLAIVALLVAYILDRLKSTATFENEYVRVGGVAAIFLVSFMLLNQFLPDIRSGFVKDAVTQPVTVETSAGERTVEVALSPATQFITKNELHSLDRNKYDIHEILGLAMPRISGENWDVGQIDQINKIGVSDLPFMQAGLEIMQTFFDMNKPIIFGLQQRKAKSLLLGEGSAIDGMLVGFNYFGDKDHVAALTNAIIKNSELLNGGSDVSEMEKETLKNFMEETRAQTQIQFREMVEKKLPIKKQIRDGVYVIPLSKEKLDSNLFTATTGTNHTLLDKSLAYMMTSGYGSGGSPGNLYVDQRRGIASFNSSVKLTNVEVEGRTTDVIMNTIGFIVTSNDRAIIVILIHSSTEELQAFKELEAFFNNLRFSA